MSNILYLLSQRLLFRVLHCLSLLLPNIGYVQGMASLAANLLCYYDEVSCFIMLARLFTTRHLENFYRHGFGGLLEAFDELEDLLQRRKLGQILVGYLAEGL